jgi:hypothetical protein
MVARELYEQKGIKIVWINPRNVRLANGHVEQVKLKARFKLCIDGNHTSIEAFLINLPEMDLVLGLPWLCLTRAVPDYNNLSYTFIDNKNKVVHVCPYNQNERPRGQLNSIISRKEFDNEFIKIAYRTAPDAFREIVGLPKDKIFEHDIDTGTAAAVKVHGRPNSPPEHLLIEKFMEEALKDGIIQPSKSPWLAPIILVKKADGSSCACVDYRKLNALTVKDSYPLPCIDDTYQFLEGARIFSSIDLKSGFWQVKLTERLIAKTVFATRNSSYEFFSNAVRPLQRACYLSTHDE